MASIFQLIFQLLILRKSVGRARNEDPVAEDSHTGVEGQTRIVPCVRTTWCISISLDPCTKLKKKTSRPSRTSACDPSTMGWGGEMQTELTGACCPATLPRVGEGDLPHGNRCRMTELDTYTNHTAELICEPNTGHSRRFD